MDIRQIEFVEAIARRANFTRAADDLHIAQPALSSAIRRLEAELGVQLFERTSRKVALTDAGQAFLVGGRRVLEEMGRLSNEIGAFAVGARGVLRASWWYQTDPQMIEYLRDYTDANPGVEVSMVQASTADSLAGLRRDDLDIASISLPRGVDLTGLAHIVVRREPYALATPAGHRLAAATSVSINDLAQERFIVTRPGTGVRSCFDHAFAARNEPPHIAIEINELSAIMALVAAGVGCAIVPPSIAGQAPVPVNLVPLTDAAHFVLAVVWREGAHSQIVQRAIDLAVQGTRLERSEDGTPSSSGPSHTWRRRPDRTGIPSSDLAVFRPTAGNDGHLESSAARRHPGAATGPRQWHGHIPVDVASPVARNRASPSRGPGLS